MDIATWNVNSLRAHLDHFVQWTAEFQPDVVCLQETKVVDELFPHAEVEAAGYPHRVIHGQQTYNGVAILSKHPLDKVRIGFTLGDPDPQARMVRATVDGVDVIGVYVPNGNPMDSHKFPYKLDWLRRLREELDHGHDAATEVLLCGDMNIAPTEADVHDPFEAEGRVLYTPEEKAALKHIVDWGFTDAYRKKNPFSSEYTWWDYRGSAFRNNQGWRIDHIYLTRPLMRRCRKVRVDRVTRTWDKPSDHAPVVVTLRDR